MKNCNILLIIRFFIQIDFSYTTSGRESRNMYTFVATSEDNNARYRCEAMNQMSIEPMKAEIVLSVQCKQF